MRERAIAQLKKQRDLRGHALVFGLVNAFLVVIWLMTDRNGFFWPILPLAGWGVGLAMNAWDVNSRDQFDEERIRRESERLQAR